MAYVLDGDRLSYLDALPGTFTERVQMLIIIKKKSS